MGSRGPGTLWPEENGHDPLDCIFFDQEEVDLVIPIEKCSGYFFTKFGPAGNCPMQTAAAIYKERLRADELRRSLASFYEDFQPKNLAQALFGNDDLSLSPLDRMSPFDQFQPWRPTIYKMTGHDGGGNQNFGPVSSLKLDKEVERLKVLIDSFADIGYRPEAYKDGFIRGYFLLEGQDYRFIVNSGMHRLSVLAALGAPRIRARFNRKLPRYVDGERANLWPHVKSGFCSEQLARRMLWRHFD